MSLPIPKAMIRCLCSIVVLLPACAAAQEREIPDPLQPWKEWATWGDRHRDCPTPYNTAEEHICFWPSQLAMTTGQQKGTWTLSVTAFADTWVPLPGSAKIWPLNVRADGEPAAVVARGSTPSVRLSAGRHQLSGEFRWAKMPQTVAIPPEIGLLSLQLDGEAVSIPDWDASGQLWLRRVRQVQAEENQLSVQVYRLIEDGIPVWLKTELELAVSGKSREEDLGWVLPKNWRLATVDSPIPVAIDELGRMKAQVRSGKWTIRLDAFRTDDPRLFQFASGATPITNVELIGFRSQNTFRLAELTGLQAVDVTQTTFPEPWRGLPIYQWETDKTFQLNEKSRGMGTQRPTGLSIQRKLWLDEDGKAFTFLDEIRGRMQQTWRLDAAEGQELGAVRIGGEGQLITLNPSSEAEGVEVRDRNLELNAIGRINGPQHFSATGWQTDADSLTVKLILPPGWRVLALFGADSVEGDWLTAWSLLDLFLLLVFSLAVYRNWGVVPGLIAFLAFGLAYHEAGSPRLTWLFLLMPVALLRVVPSGEIQRWLLRWKYLAVALLLINLIPFLSHQVQETLYPQLERAGVQYQPRSMFWRLGRVYRASARVADGLYESAEFARSPASAPPAQWLQTSKFNAANLIQEPSARIQTGPAEPAWNWNQVLCYWEGRVSTEDHIRPVLISLPFHRLITIIRIGLLLTLAALMIGWRRPTLPRPNLKPAAILLLVCLGMHPHRLEADEFPSPAVLQLLRERLLEPSDAYPSTAEIPFAKLRLTGRTISLETEVHTALQVAVPLPGYLPVWSPTSISIDGAPAELVCRKDGYLWVVLPAGVHRVVVNSMLPDVTEWEWTYLLTPRRVAIEAPDWVVSGVNEDGVPEEQVFFTRPQQSDSGEASYDRKDFFAVVAVDRYIETGIRWQVRTEVHRLSASGKAISLTLPLLPQESVLSSNAIVEGNLIEVRLAAGQKATVWESEIPIGETIALQAADTKEWVERWHVVTSPMWNMSYPGLAPIFETNEQKLIPVWQPWPGEQVTLSFQKPQAVVGETTTVQQVSQDTSLGNRQRSTALKLSVESSLGGDFAVSLPSEADIVSLSLDGNTIPVRRRDNTVMIPLRPGRQSVELNWETGVKLGTVATANPVGFPVEAYNVTSILRVADDSRWVLWASGPLRGPAIRFWTILAVAFLVALILGSLSHSPLKRYEWVLLTVGLTQVHVVAGLLVVAWLFLLARRGQRAHDDITWWRFNLRQVGLVLLTVLALAILVVAVGAGLLGPPEMFILGNNSSASQLTWFQPRSGFELPQPYVVSVSIWYYRLLMLAWALWLAAALLRWLAWGWAQFVQGGGWRRKPVIQAT